MHEKYKDKGVVLVALSYEPADKVAPFVTTHKIPYIVGADAKATQTAYGARGFPTAFLVDPDGKIAWIGHPASAEKAIEALLKKSPPKDAGPPAKEVLQAALKKADALLDARQYAQAMAAYEKLLVDFPESAESAVVIRKLDTLRSDEAVMASIRLEESNRQAAKLLTLARRLAEDGASKDAMRYYKRIIARHSDSEHARTAELELAKLEDASESGK